MTVQPGGYQGGYRKKDTNWPLWAVFGLFAFGMVVLVVKCNMTAPDLMKEPPGTVPGTPVLPPPTPTITLPEALVTNYTYKIDRETPIVDSLGADVKAPGVKMLPADTVFVVSSVKSVGDVKWYYVVVKESGGAQGAWGFISSASLEGQVILRVR